MSRKSELKRAISDTEDEIIALEKKRERSQSQLLRAVVSQEKPDPQDVEYFRVFSSLIDERRILLRSLLQELDDLKNKKKKDKNAKDDGKAVEIKEAVAPQPQQPKPVQKATQAQPAPQAQPKQNAPQAQPVKQAPPQKSVPPKPNGKTE